MLKIITTEVGEFVVLVFVHFALTEASSFHGSYIYPTWPKIYTMKGQAHLGKLQSRQGLFTSLLLLQTRHIAPAAAAKSLQSCPTLCDPIDGSPPGSPVPGILQARTLEWVAISFSNAWKWKVKSLSRVWLFATPWTAAHQAPPSMGFSRQEYWSGVPLPSPTLSRYRAL